MYHHAFPSIPSRLAMKRRRRAVLVACLMNVTAFSYINPLHAQEEPDVKQIASAGRQTVARLNSEAASWTTVIELPGGEAHVGITYTPTMRHIVVAFHGNGNVEEIVRIVERDGMWYVLHNKMRAKFRPFEAPLVFPVLNTLIARSELMFFVDDEQAMRTFVGLEEDVAIYKTELPEPMKRQLHQSLENLSQVEKSDPDAFNEKAKLARKQIQQILEDHLEQRVNLKTGIVEQLGILGKRAWVKDFQWLRQLDRNLFDIRQQEWVDQSGNLIEQSESPDDVIMISHVPSWRPGQNPGDADLLLVDIKTSQRRRVPYSLGSASTNCFSQDRKRAYVAGQIPGEGSICIFEIDLISGLHRRLGSPKLQSGVTMFPALSPNGQYLAVVQMAPDSGPLDVQVHFIDIASGKSKPVGKPFDTAFLSWLPRGDGVVLITRAYENLKDPSIDTICRMDFRGTLTPIRKGESPLVLLPRSRILFRDQDTQQWNTCDLQGKNVTMVGDGLKKFGTPTASPDGNRLMMMDFAGPQGPQLHIVDIATGTATPLSVGPGHWSRPSW